MSFSSLAVNNVKKNFSNYIMYLISAVFSVMIFYIFCSIAFNDVIMKLADNKVTVKVAFKASAVIVALFSFVFIWYSNSFFLKRRKKEIAIYSIIGMEKRQVAKMLFYENIIIGTLAIFFGIVLGGMFSKYFSLMLIYLMKETLDLKFTVVPNAFKITILVFFILFLLNSIHSYRIIYKYKLIELLSAQKEGEKVPKASVFMAVLSVLLIMLGYFIPYNKTSIQLVKLGIPIIILVSIGTYLFLNSFIIILIKAFKGKKGFYYRGENIISVSQILYRIKSNAKTLFIISMLSAVTLTSIGVSYSFYKTTEEDINKNIPFSYEFMNVDSLGNEKIKNTINKYADNKLISHSSLKLINAKVSIIDLQNKNFQGKIISQTDYNKVITIKNRGNNINLKDNECLFINVNQGDGKKHNYLNSTASVQLKTLKRDFKIIKSADIQVVSPFITRSTIIVSDNVFNKFTNKSEECENTIVDGYIVQNPEKSKELTNELSKVVMQGAYIDSYYDSYHGFYKGGAVFIFIGIFLGALFSLATSSVISFKQLIEAAEDEKRYAILRKIGMNRKEIKKSISKQLLITFGMPLIIAVCHSTAALIVFQRLMNAQTMKYCVVIMIGYTFMYFIYYIVTVNSYTNIVCNRE